MNNNYTTNSHYLTYTFFLKVVRMYVLNTGVKDCYWECYWIYSTCKPSLPQLPSKTKHILTSLDIEFAFQVISKLCVGRLWHCRSLASRNSMPKQHDIHTQKAEEIGEHWKQHYQTSRFKNFLVGGGGGHAPPPPLAGIAFSSTWHPALFSKFS